MAKADESSWLLKQQTMVETKMEKVNRSCGWCEHIVGEEQLADYPPSTLFFARFCRVMLMIFITFCVLGLMTGWILEGSMTLAEEINTKEKMPLPSIALCPQPWGSKFAGGSLTVESAQMVEIPGGADKGKAKFYEEPCPRNGGRMATCSCVNLGENVVSPHGKRGELEFFDYVQLSISGENDGPGHQWALGLYSDGMMPQQWSYVTEGHHIEGDVKMEEVATGKTEFSDGESVPRYTLRVTGDALSEDGTTILTFGYDKYLSFVISSFESKFSFFAIMTLLITFFAAINNFGLFELAFPEKSESASLEPNVCFRFLCCCFTCCQPREEPEQMDSSRGGT